MTELQHLPVLLDANLIIRCLCEAQQTDAWLALSDDSKTGYECAIECVRAAIEVELERRSKIKLN